MIHDSQPPTPTALPRDGDSLRHKLSRTMLGTVTERRLIEQGDRILVAISGGKDSYTMLDLLWAARGKAPYFSLVLVHRRGEAWR